MSAAVSQSMDVHRGKVAGALTNAGVLAPSTSMVAVDAHGR